MVADWQLVEFGDLLLNGTRNGVFKAKELHGSGVKIVNMGELFAYPRLRDVPMKRVELTDSELERSELQPGDLLFARRSLVAEGAGKCSIVMAVNEPTTFESSIIRARPDRARANSLFLYYLFSSPHGRYLLGTILRQVAVSGITGSDLVKLKVLIPSLKQQQAIACILGSLDDKIELNRRMNQTLEATAAAIFKSWFVDFDPVRAKAAGEQPPGLASHLAELFSDSFHERAHGEIPTGWREIGLNEVGSFLNGLALQKYPPQGAESLPVIKIAQLRNGNTEGADRASAQLEQAYIVEDGDVLFSWSGSLDCVIWTGGPGALNQHLFKVTSDQFPKWFYYFWIHRHLPWFRHIAAGKATTMGHIQRHHLVEAKVFAPHPPLLAQADQVISPLLTASVSRTLECRRLVELRDAMLPRIVSGQVAIPDAERIIARCS